MNGARAGQADRAPGARAAEQALAGALSAGDVPASGVTLFEDIVRLAATICRLPLQAVTLFDACQRRVGGGLRSPIETAHELQSARLRQPRVIADLSRSPLPPEDILNQARPAPRFYARLPLFTADGARLASLLILGDEPQELSPDAVAALSALLRQAAALLALREETAAVQALRQQLHERETARRARARFEAELQAAQRLEAIERIAEGLAKEISLPMRVIAQNLRFAENSAFTLMHAPGRLPANELDFIETRLPYAFRNCRDALARVDQLLGLMPQAGSQDSHDAVDLARCLKDSLAGCAAQAGEYADVVCRIDPMPAVPGDPEALRRVFDCLLLNAVNAVRASGRRGRIDIRSRQHGDAVEIRIEDNGPGLDGIARDRAFEPVFTATLADRPAQPNLFRAHSTIVGQHGGSLSIDSALGLGTRFTVRLPLNGRIREDSLPGVLQP